MLNKICGVYDDVEWWGPVTFDGRTLPLDPSLDVINHSPDGFAWSYSGSGPSQLALAILLEAGVPVDQARKLYQEFKHEFIAGLPRASFELVVDVQAWATEKG
jgi:hypothetical protein